MEFFSKAAIGMLNKLLQTWSRQMDKRQFIKNCALAAS
ncbi:MAG: hypothetical protein ACI8U1_001772, partial [Rheinheimera aquimaris]